MIEFRVSYHESGQRLDRLLRKHFATTSLSKIFSTLRKKKVRLNGKRAKGEEILSENDQIQVYENLEHTSTFNAVEEPVGWGKVPEKTPFELPILFEDEHLLILNKPFGLAVQPGSNVPQGESVIEKVWGYTGEPNKAQLAHRLDLHTSGVLCIGKDGPTIRNLTKALRERSTEKVYLALVAGLVEPSGQIELALERSEGKRTEKIKAGSGKKSLTSFERLETFEGCSLVRVFLGTGRMHQIRVHFASIGHPLLGDDRYGDFKRNREFRKSCGLKRLFLHAASFSLQNEKRSFEAPLADDLQQALTKLRSAKIE